MSDKPQTTPLQYCDVIGIKESTLTTDDFYKYYIKIPCNGPDQLGKLLAYLVELRDGK